jgi:hypothetical protein
LGAYGNTWIRTPAFDRLASEGFTFDEAFIESPQLELFYDACWLGRHPMGPPGPIDAGRSLPALLSAKGVSARLLTDDRTVAEHRLAGAFGEIVQFDLPAPRCPADSIADTLLGRCFAQALELLDSARAPFLLWCHLGSLGTAWDAPRDLRLANCDEGDPEPPDIVLPPNTLLAEDYDPDGLLGFSQVYAAQACVLDACLAALRDWMTASSIGGQTLLVVISARGFPLGEHRRVGGYDSALYTELVQVPMMLRFPDQSYATDRSRALVQPSDLYSTLCEWHSVGDQCLTNGRSLWPLVTGDSNLGRQCVGILGSGTERALVTPAWYLRQGSHPELFLRPDDRWCANDVADRCPEIVASMLSVISQYSQAMQSSLIKAIPALGSDLLVGPD